MRESANYLKFILICFMSYLFISCSDNSTSAPEPIKPPEVKKTFKNPLITGSDPWIFQKDGIYYYTHTSGNSINLWKATSVTGISKATPIKVYSPASSGPNTKNIWAPEIHFINNKWYIYYTAGDGTDASQRTWVLENSNLDPTVGEWVDKGKIYDSSNELWCIDGSIMQHNNDMYYIWCGRPDKTNKNKNQSIYITKMTNPWTLEGASTMISTPTYTYEKATAHWVNEGPQSLKAPNGKQMIIFSASYCGNDNYSLGQLTLKDGGNPLNLSDWVKSTDAVFSKSISNRAYGPGHNGFFKSPDGTEDWIIYHANSNANEGCGTKRNIRMQKFTFTANGDPIFGTPVAIDQDIVVPSGEK